MFLPLAALAVGSVAGQWTTAASDIGTIAAGCAFTDKDTGYLPVAVNGVGTQILKSVDGGFTWNDDETAAPFSLLLLDIAAHKGAAGNDNVAVVGALTFEYSTDGAITFNSSLAPVGAGQCIRNIADTPEAFAAVGSWGLLTESNGPAVSYDAGAVFVAINVTELQTEGRYGAFPTKSTWFITAGDWPSDDDPNPPPRSALRAGSPVDVTHYREAIAPGATLVKRHASRVHLLQEPSGALKWASVRSGRLHAANGGGEYQAQIAKTSDSGKTWQVVFSDMGDY